MAACTGGHASLVEILVPRLSGREISSKAASGLTAEQLATRQLERMVALHEEMDEDIARMQTNRRVLRKAIDEHPARKILNPSKRRKLDDDWSWHSWWGW